MMFNGAMGGRHGGGGGVDAPGVVSPLPSIGTVLSHREDIESLLHWTPSSMTLFEPADINDLFDANNNTGDNNGDNNNNHLDGFPEMWGDSSRKDDDYLGLGSSLPADEGRNKVEKSAAFLNLSIDPVSWTREEVLTWLRYSMRCNHSSPGMIVEEDWMVDGKGLCERTLEDFVRRLPKDGDVIHSELQLWKTVYEIQNMNGYHQIHQMSPIMGLFAEDYGKDSIFNCNPIYTNLESAEGFHPHLDTKYMVAAAPNLLQADPNLQQVTGSCGQATFGSKLGAYCEYNNNNNGNNNNGNNGNNIGNSSSSSNREQLMYGIVKAEQTDDIQSNADDNSWLMHNSVTSSTSFYQEQKPKLNHQRKWPLTRAASDGVSSAMPDVVATVTHRRGKRTITLWQFLKELLIASFPDPAPIRWLDREKGIFKIEDSVRVAKLWGERKNRPAMNYDKLSRSIRQYYKKGIIKKTSNSKRLVYQFCPEFL